MFLRGVVAGLLIFHLAHLAWPGPHRVVRTALAAFTLSVLAYLICSMHPASGWLGSPLMLLLLALCVTTAPLLWLAVRAVFDDGFGFTMPAVGLLVAAMLLGLAAHAPIEVWQVSIPARRALQISYSLTMLCFVAAALWEIARGWQADLVEPRRAARRWVALGIGVYAAAVVVIETALRDQPIGRLLPDLHVAGIGAVALALAIVVARRSMNEFLGSAESVSGTVKPRPETGANGHPSPASSQLFARLKQAMTEERAYRQEGLTLAALAERLRASEAALRGLINQGLGYRNFNDFLHHYRIDEAAARLGVEDLPILTIALECGYGSIGPFNRVFKQRFGMTPTEYRVAGKWVQGRGPTTTIPASAVTRNTK